MNLYFRVAGVDKDGYFAVDTCRISGNINGRWTFYGTVEGGTAAYRPERGQTIQIDDGASPLTVYFAGNISRVVERRKPGTLLSSGNPAIQFDIEAWDYNHIAARRLVTADFEDATLYEIVTHINTYCLSGEGVTLGGVTNPGPTITDKLSFRLETVESVFNKLSAITGYLWYIDFDKELQFAPFTSTAAPFGLTEDSLNWRDVEIEVSDEDYRNRQHVRSEIPVAATAGSSSGTPTEAPITANAGQELFLTAQIIRKINSITVNGVAKTSYGIPSGGAIPGSGYDFYYFVGTPNFVALDWGPASGGETITVDYLSDANPLATDSTSADAAVQGIRVVTVNDVSEQALRKITDGGSGVWEAVEEQRNLSSLGALQAIAEGRLRQYGSEVRIVTFETDEPGLLPGQRIDIDLSEVHGINDTFLIERVDIDIVAGESDFLRTRARCTTAEPGGNPTGYFEKLVENSRIGLATAGAVFSTTTDIGSTASGTPNAPAVAAASVTATGWGYNLAQDYYEIGWEVTKPSSATANWAGFMVYMTRSDQPGVYLGMTPFIPKESQVSGKFGTAYGHAPMILGLSLLPSSSVTLTFKVVNFNAVNIPAGGTQFGAVDANVWSAATAMTGSPITLDPATTGRLALVNGKVPGSGFYVNAATGLEFTKKSASLTKNWDFEQGGTDNYADWTKTGTAYDNTSLYVSGARGVTLNSSDASLRQYVEVQPGQRIYVEGWFLSNSADMAAALWCSFWDKSGSWIDADAGVYNYGPSSGSTPKVTADTWTRFALVAVCPAGAARMRISMEIISALGGSSYLWVVDSCWAQVQSQEVLATSGGFTSQLLVGMNVASDSIASGVTVQRSDGMTYANRAEGIRWVGPNGTVIGSLSPQYDAGTSSYYAQLQLAFDLSSGNSSLSLNPIGVVLSDDDGARTAALYATAAAIGLVLNGSRVVTVRQSAISDLAGGATLGDVISKVNAILSMLRTHGLIST